jgi:predicted  nucleic acid-binding Zn-ribbon protein
MATAETEESAVRTKGKERMMSDNLESMERRLSAVERELADVRERLRQLMPEEEALPGRNVRMLHEAQIKQAALAETAQAVFASLGISPERIEAEAAQRQMLAEGVRPEDNSFRRSIVEMREE